MKLVDRLRTEYAVQRYDFWLELRGVRSSRRRELRRELRTNLAEAAADVGVTSALFGIGSPQQLAYAATEADASRPRWSLGAFWAVGTFSVLMVWMALTSLTIVQTVESAGVTEAVDVQPFPWLGTTFTVESSPGALSAGVHAPWQLIVGPLLAFLLVAQPWRLLRSKDRSPAATADRA